MAVPGGVNFPLKGTGRHTGKRRPKGVRYCARCGTKLNSYNSGDYCGPCIRGRRERNLERHLQP